MYEINLVTNKGGLVLVYNWYMIPSVGDVLLITEEVYFTVTSRLFPVTDSRRVVLKGEICK
jgi:hypothetical protein